MTIYQTGMDDERQAWLDGLRAAADWFEQNPRYIDRQEIRFAVYVSGWNDDAAENMAAAARALGKADKDTTGNYFGLTRQFGPHVVHLFTDRNAVCERIVVGTETVEVEGPDPEAVAALPTVKRTETREVVEWHCPPSILAAGTPAPVRIDKAS